MLAQLPAQRYAARGEAGLGLRQERGCRDYSRDHTSGSHSEHAGHLPALGGIQAAEDRATHEQASSARSTMANEDSARVAQIIRAEVGVHFFTRLKREFTLITIH